MMMSQLELHGELILRSSRLPVGVKMDNFVLQRVR